MKILVPNIGSTSLKWKLFDFSNDADPCVLHEGRIERVTDYAYAVDQCVAELHAAGALGHAGDLGAIAFKTVVAKGVSGCVRIDEDVIHAMEAFNAVAPAHNPPYIAGIRLFARSMPRVPLIALFETAFYQSAPERMMRYAVPDTWLAAGVRRWGFHGASHRFIAERTAALLGRPDARVISCHLGGSSSVTGTRGGVAIGNSLGMSPQSGIPQNNRVGDLDPAALPYAMRTFGLSIEEAERQLARDSGLLGLSGISNDVRDLERAAAGGHPGAALALDVFAAGVRHWIGVFFLELNGADALVFTAGIGEHSAAVRHRVCADLDGLGIVLDPARNTAPGSGERTISTDGSRIPIFVIPTNEELIVAREVHKLVSDSDDEHHPRTTFVSSGRRAPVADDHRQLRTTGL